MEYAYISMRSVGCTKGSDWTSPVIRGMFGRRCSRGLIIVIIIVFTLNRIVVAFLLRVLLDTLAYATGGSIFSLELPNDLCRISYSQSACC